MLRQTEGGVPVADAANPPHYQGDVGCIDALPAPCRRTSSAATAGAAPSPAVAARVQSRDCVMRRARASGALISFPPLEGVAAHSVTSKPPDADVER